MKQELPRIIHQISFNDKPCQYADKWRQLNPNWSFKVWDKNNLHNEFGNLENVHNYKNLYKFLILQKYGGVYAEKNLEPLKNIDYLIGDINHGLLLIKKNSNLFSKIYHGMKYNNMDYFVDTYFMISTKNHPFINYLIDQVKLRKNSGVNILTISLKNFYKVPDHVLMDHTIFEPVSWCYYENECDSKSCKFKYPNVFSILHHHKKNRNTLDYILCKYGYTLFNLTWIVTVIIYIFYLKKFITG